MSSGRRNTRTPELGGAATASAWRRSPPSRNVFLPAGLRRLRDEKWRHTPAGTGRAETGRLAAPHFRPVRRATAGLATHRFSSAGATSVSSRSWPTAATAAARGELLSHRTRGARHGEARRLAHDRGWWPPRTDRLAWVPGRRWQGPGLIEGFRNTVPTLHRAISAAGMRFRRCSGVLGRWDAAVAAQRFAGFSSTTGPPAASARCSDRGRGMPTQSPPGSWPGRPRRARRPSCPRAPR